MERAVTNWIEPTRENLQNTSDIGSVSKQFTAAAVALLDVEGALSIDDAVRT